MSSKTAIAAAMLVGVVLLASCAGSLPWNNVPGADEVNLSFVLRKNLLFLPSATVNGKPGHYFFGSAASRSAVDGSFAAALRGSPIYTFGFGSRSAAKIEPAILDLHGLGDALIGADIVANRTVTIDYRAGLVTVQEHGIQPAYMTLYHYAADPEVTVEIGGRSLPAIIDTALPDTIVIPSDHERRADETVKLAGADLGSVDVKYADVERARIGNRVLSRFLVSIDYGKRVVGLWRDPRIR